MVRLVGVWWVSPVAAALLLTALLSGSRTVLGSGLLPSRARGGLVILGQVAAVGKKAVNRFTTRYTYRVRVVGQQRGRPQPGVVITVVGLRRTSRTPGGTQIPLMSNGTYFLMAVMPARGGRSYRYVKTEQWFPLGVGLPSPVAKRDVAGLAAALREYGRLRKMGKLVKSQAFKLRDSRNFYLWALGTRVIAIDCTHKDVYTLLDGLFRNLSPRRAFWILHCVRRVAPPAVRPSRGMVLSYLTSYLARLSKAHEPGYKP